MDIVLAIFHIKAIAYLTAAAPSYETKRSPVKYSKQQEKSTGRCKQFKQETITWQNHVGNRMYFFYSNRLCLLNFIERKNLNHSS